MARINKVRKEKERPRLTLQEIHERTGIHRKILSRLINRPHENTSSEHIDRLSQFFFEELRKEQSGPTEEFQVMRDIIGDLVQVFPDAGAYKESVTELCEHEPMRGVPIWQLWQFYAAKVSGRSLPFGLGGTKGKSKVQGEVRRKEK
ncbi:MAG: hypothetical protein GYA55_01075 [SAR324 cluster bacterium]|uniref:Uncharacterized protein n=1 Tax=SAR324 cluster bacterium TaxID=2024889 RepID=A0A7X9II66_9DELT|nr:hypothetical protein [SAR324 cluster bacterium]